MREIMNNDMATLLQFVFQNQVILACLGGVLANMLLWLSFYLAQRYESRYGKIPERKRFGSYPPSKDFLYIEDYHTTFWGDIVGASLVCGAFALLLPYITLDTIALALVLSGTTTLSFHLINMHPRHRPNFSYPTTTSMSLTGILHLGYFFILACTAFIVALTFLRGTEETLPLFLFFAGSSFYALMFARDIYTGRFELLPKI